MSVTLPNILDSFSVCLPFPSGVQAYWSMEEASGTLSDATGNGYDLTSTDLLTYHAAGKHNYCISPTNEVGSYAYGTTTGLHFTNLSISAWFKTTYVTQDKQIVGKYYWSPNANGFQAYISYDGYPTFIAYSVGSSSAFTATSFGSLNDGNWHHVVFTFENDTKYIRIYVDGDEDTSSPYTCLYTLVYIVDSTPIYVGTNYWQDNGFVGSLDEIGVWNRVLSATEVSDLWNGGDGCFYT